MNFLAVDWGLQFLAGVIVFLMISSLINRAKRFINSITNHPYKTLAVVFIFWFLEWRWGFESSFFITLFFLFLLLEWDYRILISFALLFLLSCPFYLIVENKFRAEQMAIYAYYLLFIGTVLALIEHIRVKKEKDV
jgi:hypothetical protein